MIRKPEKIIIGVKEVVNKSIAKESPSAFKANEMLGFEIHVVAKSISAPRLKRFSK